MTLLFFAAVRRRVQRFGPRLRLPAPVVPHPRPSARLSSLARRLLTRVRFPKGRTP